MRVLFAVFVLCIAALIFTLMAFRRHIHKHRAHPGEFVPPRGASQDDSLNQNH